MKKNVSFRVATLVSALILIDAMPVYAAVLPGSVLPDQVAKSLTAQQPVAATPSPQQNLQPAAPQQSAASEQAKKIKFTLKAIKLKGNHVYTTETLSHFYKKLIHKEIPVSDLFDVVQNITNFYRNNGYILSNGNASWRKMYCTSDG
jgi:hemolysin activation/secretion protein